MSLSLSDFLDHDLFPTLYRVLDRAFPEFGFRQRAHSWVATNEAHTRTLPGAPRPDRIEAYPNTPFGFIVHGGDFTPWVQYLSGGHTPRGEEFIEAITALANKAGLPVPADLTETGDPVYAEQQQRQRTLLETFLHFSRAALTTPAATGARRYLTESRGFDSETWDIGEFGFYPSTRAVRDHLRQQGFSDDEIGYSAAEVGEGRAIGSGVLYDGRWEGRLIGPWRDLTGRIINMWARDLSAGGEPHSKYLMLKGGSKRTPFGLHNVRQADVVIVEGFMDVLSLKRLGVPNVVGIGGAGLTEEQIASLQRARVKQITLNFDYDGEGEPSNTTTAAPQGGAGHVATEQALTRLAKSGLYVYVVNPSKMADESERDVKVDPDSYAQQNGVEGYKTLLRTATRGMLYLAERTFARHDITAPQGKDAAFDALIPPIEQLRDEREREDTLRYAAATLGYSYEALAGIFTDYATRRRAEQFQQELARQLDTTKRDLDRGEHPPLVISQQLSGALAKLQSRVIEEPLAFSVMRLDEETRNLPTGIPSGWKALDALGSQFNAGELTVFGARTGHGKTTVQVNLLLNWMQTTKDADSKFIFYSMEEPEVRVYHRLLGVLTASMGEGWTANEVRDFLRNPYSRETWSRPPRVLQEAKAILQQWEDRLLIVHRPNWTVADIEAHARAQAEQASVSAVLVDYLQRIGAPAGEKFDRRDIEVTIVARRLKVLAGAIKAPIVAAAQIGREAVRDGMKIPDKEPFLSREVQKAIRSRRPKLHQLREGGSEQEADFVLGLLNYRADYEMDDEERGKREVPDATRFEIGTMKHRYGTPGNWAALVLEGRYGYIRDARPGELDGNGGW